MLIPIDEIEQTIVEVVLPLLEGVVLSSLSLYKPASVDFHDDLGLAHRSWLLSDSPQNSEIHLNLHGVGSQLQRLAETALSLFVLPQPIIGKCQLSQQLPFTIVLHDLMKPN